MKYKSLCLMTFLSWQKWNRQSVVNSNRRRGMHSNEIIQKVEGGHLKFNNINVFLVHG